MRALTQNDEALLCGRADVIREVVDNCRSERVVVVTSEPGLGVTSLLDAGIGPALRRAGFIVTSFRDWQQPAFAANLREAVAKAVREDSDPLFHPQGEELDKLFEHIRLHAGKPVAVLLDQFEDYVRCHVNTMASDLFDAELGRAVASRKGALVFGLQEHAIPAFERLSYHIPNLLGFQVRLTPLSVEAAREAVIAEVHGMGFEVEPAALDALLSAPVAAEKGAAGEVGVHPFFLKVATGELLDEEARSKSAVLRASTIEARGGVDRIVLESFDAALDQLSPMDSELFFHWCNILISPEKHRLSVTEKGLADYSGKLNGLVPALLKQLMEAGIVRQVETPQATRYEISRDCFTPIVRDWWELREAAIVTRRRGVFTFRAKSMSLAVAAIVLVYVLWLLFRPK